MQRYSPFAVAFRGITSVDVQYVNDKYDNVMKAGLQTDSFTAKAKIMLRLDLRKLKMTDAGKHITKLTFPFIYA